MELNIELFQILIGIDQIFIVYLFPHPTEVYPKPLNYELMKECSGGLAGPFKLVRVDLYENNGEIRLGELTFTHFNSHIICSKQEHNIELGKYLKLF